MPRVMRAMAIVLMLLAASPVTAPFASCDIVDLLGLGPHSTQAGSAIKPPSSQEGSAVVLQRSVAGTLPLPDAPPSLRVLARTGVAVRIPVPLRI